MSVEERAYELIIGNRYLNLATCSKGEPWIAAVAYAPTISLDFVFYSATGSRHITETLTNNIIAFSIYNSSLSSDDVDGLQAKGFLHRISDSDLDKTVSAYYRFSFPDEKVRARWERPAHSFAGNAPQKFFTLSLTELYVIDLENTEVDGRASVDVSGVRRLHAG